MHYMQRKVEQSMHLHSSCQVGVVAAMLMRRTQAGIWVAHLGPKESMWRGCVRACVRVLGRGRTRTSGELGAGP